MQKLIIRLFFILASAAFANVYGQNITFNHLTTDDGLSQFSVNSLYVDENGILWIGTREGLNRYNGDDIQTYKLQKNNPNSLFCNTVSRITGNHNGKIYLLCTEGVAEFNLATQKFTTLIQGNINSIYYNDGLFIGKKNEIYRYNEETGNFDLYYQLPDRNLEIVCIHINKDVLWLGTTTNGVYCLNIDKKELTHPIQKGNITSFYQDSESELWIGSWEEGLFRVKADGTIENFKYNAKDPHSLSSNFVRACCEDNLGNIWIGTFNGLNRYNKITGLFQNHTANDTQADGLTHSSIWCIVKDNQGTLWLGTYFGGVNYFNPEYEIYTRYSYSSNEKKGLSNPVVGRTIEDRDGNLWIGTEGGGLNYYNRRTREFKWYRPQEGRNSISHNNVKALYYDADKEIIWIGTHLGGLNKLDIRSGHFTHYRMEEGNPNTLPSDIIRDIIPYKSLLIIATQNGVCLFDPANGQCQQLFKDSKEGKSIKMVADVTFDSEGTLWIAATGEGVFSYRFDTCRLTNYRHDATNPNSLSNNNVNNITQDSKGNLWFSTSGSGLDLYRPATNDFENFDKERNGLASDCIYETQESPSSGKLLLITNEGFSIFNYKNKTFNNYSAENGFPLTAVNENALCVTCDGEIFLGGIQGMISFHEMELNFTPKPYKIILSRLIVNGREISVGDKTGILQHSLCHTGEITLNADQSMFSIEFATSNYIPANKDDIIYRLEGFSNEWTSTRGLHTITYTNLNAGTYTLLIKPEGKDENLCPQAQLTIHVLPPYYKTTLAYFIYIIITGAVLWYLIRAYKSKIKLRESLKYEQKHIQDVEALNQSKLRFFTNISHEFRTPLTLIVAQVETLLQLQNFTPAIYNKILGIYKNSIQLRELITELLDFRKQEQGHMKIKVSPHNIVNFLYENYLLFLEYASAKQINFNFEKETDELEVWYDQKQMQKVINNLLSNAIKHTPDGGSITLDVMEQEKGVSIHITDSGTGMTEEVKKHIFERFYSESGVGIGLSLTKSLVELHKGTILFKSTEGEGTVFQVFIPFQNKNTLIEPLSETTTFSQEDSGPFTASEYIHPEIEDRDRDMSDKPALLIVDDNKGIVQILDELFCPYYKILTTFNGKEAFDLCLSQIPSLVISDIYMPEMNGIELCSAIKSTKETSHIPVILLTAKTSKEIQQEGLSVYADAYCSKPFDNDILISTVHSILTNRQMLAQKFSNNLMSEEDPTTVFPEKTDRDFIQKIIKVVEDNIANEELSVSLLCRTIGMSQLTLNKKIKQLTNQTTNAFIRSIRLKVASQMILSQKYSISEVTYAVGFSDLRYFRECFKKEFGVLPSDYKK